MTGSDATGTSQRRRILPFLTQRLRGFQRPPRPTKGDVVAGITTGIANIPDGMSSGVIAGINPVYGLYSLMVNTPVGALTISTQLMVVNTTSSMILVASDGLGDLQGDERVQAMIGISLVAGVFQFILGFLGLGTLTKFVSNSVMTGLLTGVAILIILGQLWDFFGYIGDGDTRIQKTIDLFTHFGDIDGWTTLIGLLSIGLMIWLGRTRLAQLNLLIALVIATVLAALLDRSSISLVSSLGDIPRGLPDFQIPRMRDVFMMLVAGVAVGVVGLLQAAGVAQRYPNPDGKEPDDSQDFMAQGLANVAGSFFQAMPTGGSLGGTALSVSAGARTRWTPFFMAIVVMVAVLAFADLLTMIPIAGLAALLIYSASLSIKFPLIRAVLRTNWHSWATMLLTFVATLVVPLQQAIMVGVIAAAVLFIYRSSTDIRIARLRVEADGVYEEALPAKLDDGDTVILDIYGSLFYAGARTLSQMLPPVNGAKSVIVVLRLRGLREVGSTLLNVLNGYARDLQASGGDLFLASIAPDVKDRMVKSQHTGVIAADHIFVSSPRRFGSLEDAEMAAADWRVIADRRAELETARGESLSHIVPNDPTDEPPTT